MTDPILVALRDRLVEALSASRVILFGSRASGTARSDSDYDILVVADCDLPLEERVFQARRAVRDVRASKDIVVVTPDEFRECSTWVSGIVREAVGRGEVLYEAA